MKVFFTLVSFLASSAAASEELSVTTAEGEIAEVFVAGPETAGIAVLVVHDWFGLSDATRNATLRLGEVGLRAAAIDLYGAPSVETHDEAQVLMEGPDAAESLTRLQAGVEYLQAEREDRRIAVVGYSMGARHALEAAVKLPDSFDAAALVYGGGYGEVSDFDLTSAPPILVVAGTADDWALGELQVFEARAVELDLEVDTYTVAGARHAFAQPLFDGGASFDPSATRVLNGVLDAFIAAKLEN